MFPFWNSAQHDESLASCADRVEDIKGGIAKPGQPVRHRYTSKGEDVVGVTDHFGEGPREEHCCVERVYVGAGEARYDSPYEDEARGDLDDGCGERGAYEAEQDMDHFESGERLDGCKDRPGC